MYFYGVFFINVKMNYERTCITLRLLFCQTFYKITPPPLSIAMVGVSSVLSLVGDHEGKPCHDEEDTYI